MTRLSPTQHPLSTVISPSQSAQRVAAVLLAFLLFIVIATPRAFAVSDSEELTRFGSVGEAAGQLMLPRGIATDPTTGHVFTAESAGAGGTSRISEFTPWGEFVKAFGWDVAPGAVNEQQEVRVRAAGGQFKLSFGADASTDLPFNANAEAVKVALEALPSIGAGDIAVKAVSGNLSGSTPFIYVVSFKGALAATNVAQLGAVNGTTPLSDGVPSTSLVVRTRADGTAPGTGLESCTAESGCKAGLEDEGAGEFSTPWGIAVDVAGDIYVRELGNNRVQKFDSAGRFLLMFGGEVDKTSGADVCTKEDIEVDHDVCGVGTSGTGQGEFGEGFDVVLGADGTVFVPDKERIEEFEPSGAFKGEVKVAGETVRRLAVNPKSGGFYAVFGVGAGKDNLRELSAAGAVEGSCPVKAPEALASDADGNVYVVGGENTPETGRQVLELDSSCKQIASLAEAELLPNAGSARFDLSGLGISALGDLYVTNTTPSVDSFIRAFGPAPVSFEAPPPVPPSISAQFASSVLRNGATVAAEINPHFFTDTHYFVQYGIGRCSEGGCGEEQPIAPGAILTAKVFGTPLRSAGVSLQGLDPGTTYHYRFVAESGGGGPVFGMDPDGPAGPEEATSEDGLEATFTTFPAALPPSSCPNDTFRTGPDRQEQR